MGYAEDFNRMSRKYERIYGPKVNAALRSQIAAYIEYGTVEAINSHDILNVLQNIYNSAGVNWAYRSMRDMRIKKARKPFGFTERIINLIQSQYSVDLLNMSKNITETTKDQVRTVLQQAAVEGWGRDQIVGKLRQYDMTSARASLIARTETVCGMNGAAYVNGLDLGAELKIWISTNDNRTRPDHIELNDQRVGIYSKFKIVDQKGITREMSFPGDKNGGPGQICNCRCAMGFE